MQKIGSLTATADPQGEFTGGDPGQGTPATIVDPGWLNTVQRELVAIVEAAGLTLDGGNDAQGLAAIQAIAATAQQGLRNGLINGGFHIAQRESAFSNLDEADGLTYTVDRWAFQADGSGGAGVGSVSRQAFGITPEVAGATWFLRLVQSAAATVSRPRLRQVIEGLQDWSGRQVTLSFYARTQVATQLEVGFVQKIGGPASDVELGALASTVNLTSSWQQFSVTVDLPDPSFAVQPGNGLAIEFRPLLGQTHTIELAQIQIESGGAASAFEVRPLELERLLCERYYQQSYPDGTAAGALGFNVPAGAPLVAPVIDDNPDMIRHDFAVQMRATPTMRWFSPVTGAEGQVTRYTDPSTPYDFALAGGASAATPKTTGHPDLDFGSGGIEDVVYVHWTADAEL